MTDHKKYPPVMIVDESDNEIGSAALTTEVWPKGLYHRVATVFIQDFDGNILLQLRGNDVAVFPNLWDQAVGGHVEAGSSYKETAIKEMAEETGLKAIELKVLGTFKTNIKLGDDFIINQFERAYLGKVQGNTKLRPEPDEVRKLQWFKPSELKQLISKNPENFAPGLLYALKSFPELWST
jgi:isopentenyldiphosphate isomerase